MIYKSLPSKRAIEMKEANSLNPRLSIKNGATKIVNDKITDHIFEDENFFRQSSRLDGGNGVVFMLIIRSHSWRVEGARESPRATVHDIETMRDERRGVESKGGNCWIQRKLY